MIPRLQHLLDRKSTRLNSSHSQISYAVFCLKKKKNTYKKTLPTTKKKELTPNYFNHHLQLLDTSHPTSTNVTYTQAFTTHCAYRPKLTYITLTRQKDDIDIRIGEMTVTD